MRALDRAASGLSAAPLTGLRGRPASRRAVNGRPTRAMAALRSPSPTPQSKTTSSSRSSSSKQQQRHQKQPPQPPPSAAAVAAGLMGAAPAAARRRWQQLQLDQERARLEAALARQQRMEEEQARQQQQEQQQQRPEGATATTATTAPSPSAPLLAAAAATLAALAALATTTPTTSHLLLDPLHSAWTAYLRALEEHPLPAKLATGVFGALAGDAIAQLLTARRSLARSQSSWSYDVPRAARMVAFSALVGTPFAMAEYALLDGAGAAADAAAAAAAVSSSSAAAVDLAASSSSSLPAVASAASTIVMPEPTVAEAAVAEAVAAAVAAVPPQAPPPPLLLAAFGKVAADQLVASPAGMAVFFLSIKLMEGKGLEQAAREMAPKMWPSLLANWRLWIPAQTINFALVPADLRIAFVNVVAIGWTAYLSAAANDDDGQGGEEEES